MNTRRLSGVVGSLCIGAAAITAAADTIDPVSEQVWSQVAKSALHLDHCTVIQLDTRSQVDRAAVLLDVTINGAPEMLELFQHSVRSDLYELVVQQPDGSLRNITPGPIRTYRGSVLGNPDSRVAASLDELGLRATIYGQGASRWWIEPLRESVAEAPVSLHVVYRDDDVRDSGGHCGTPGLADADNLAFRGDNVAAYPLPSALLGQPCIAQLACDADTEYFNLFGTVSATEAKINGIINTVNLQYESEVNITHLVTTIIVRTGADPYTMTDAEDRLCEFITEWTNNQDAVTRDVAHLFTGINLDGSTIGRAADIGDTGICENDGGCTGGTFDTFGSYCIAQDVGGAANETDLTAHELGHLWGASHCDCPSNTMNPNITGANTFTAGTITSITGYAATRTCLTGTCAFQPTGACCFEDGSCQELGAFDCNNAAGMFSYEGDGTTCGPNPCPPSGACCFNDGSCMLLIESVCNSMGNVNEWQAGETCGPNPCPQPGACCFDDGSCLFILEDDCNAMGNVNLWMANMDCSPNPCPQPGACCFLDGSCQVLLEVDCDAAPNVWMWQGDNTDCTPNLCPQPGACCLPNETCDDTLIEPICDSMGGIFKGEDTMCGDFPDCNMNGVPDDCDIDFGFSEDCNLNGIPDECDTEPLYDPDPSVVINGADLCVNAPCIGPNTYTGTTIGATGSNAPDDVLFCGPWFGVKDVYYCYIPKFDAEAYAYVRQTPANFGPPDHVMLAVYEGCPAGEHNLLTCQGNQHVGAHFPVKRGEQYFIRIAKTVNQESDFELTLTGPGPVLNPSDFNDNGIPDECECFADVTGPLDIPDAIVDFHDFLAVLGRISSGDTDCPGGCPEDVDMSGKITQADLQIVFDSLGPCPFPSPAILPDWFQRRDNGKGLANVADDLRP